MKAQTAIRKERAAIRKELRQAKARIRELIHQDKVLTAALEVMTTGRTTGTGNGRGPDREPGRRETFSQLGERIVQQLQRTPAREWTPGELSDALGAPLTSVYNATNMLKAEGRISVTEGRNAREPRRFRFYQSKPRTARP